ncbi:MAG: nitroreductase family protein [Spirochaetes bacterium]|nr:nitroreductase family protein [Spirochaetota bacterium]
MIKELIFKNRSYRRFDESHEITEAFLKDIIELARLSGSAANRQPLKYKIVTKEEERNLLFNNIKWAGYLTDWDGPQVGERPSGYIIILYDRNIEANKEFLYCDLGLASQNILLGLVEKNLGGCMIGSINKENIINKFKIRKQYEILLIIAIGKPKETIILDDVKNDDIKYYRDKNDCHHVPKRKLSDIII